MTGVLDLRRFFGKGSGPFPKNMCELKVTRHPTSRHSYETSESIRIHMIPIYISNDKCDHHKSTLLHACKGTHDSYYLIYRIELMRMVSA